MAISSFAMVFAFADFGVGNGVLSAISTAIGNNNPELVKKYISSAYASLSLVAIFLGTGFVLFYYFLSWDSILNVNGDLAKSEAGPSVLIFFLCFVVAIPLTIVQRVQMALQKGFIASFWQCAASITSLIFVYIFVEYKLSLPWFVFACSGIPLLFLFLNSVIFFSVQYPEYIPKIENIEKAISIKLMNTGWLFFALQIVVAVAYSSDSFIISRLCGAEAVTEYSIAEKMFGVVGFVVSIALTPLWPAYGEAIACGDVAWAKKMLLKSMVLAVVSSVIMVGAIFVFHNEILMYWIGSEVNVSILTLVGFSVWKIFEAIGVSLGMFLNGAHVVLIQLVFSFLTMIASVGLKFYLIEIYGVAGAIWGSVLAFLIFSLIPYIFYMPKVFRLVEQNKHGK